MKELYTRQESLDLNTNQNILIIGVGGIGWSMTKFLAMAGVNDLTIFDDDTVEIHNLPRLDVPFNCLGKNKAGLLADYVLQMRPESNIIAYPFRFNPDVIEMDDIDVVIDCTDNFKSQIANQAIAKDSGCVYIKAGYNGKHITIATSIGEWDTDPDTDSDGYTIIPSYISPAVIVSGMVVDMVLSGNIQEVSCDITDLYITK